jgi:predicted nucleic acid-binding protein
MTAYADSSALLARILKEPSAVRWGRFERLVTSELTRVELLRTIHRLKLGRRLSDSMVADATGIAMDILARAHRVPISPAVLDRATAPFPTVVGTLDAIHLATALLWVEERDEPVVFLTHDKRLSLAARAHGLEVEGV